MKEPRRGAAPFAQGARCASQPVPPQGGPLYLANVGCMLWQCSSASWLIRQRAAARQHLRLVLLMWAVSCQHSYACLANEAACSCSAGPYRLSPSSWPAPLGNMAQHGRPLRQPAIAQRCCDTPLTCSCSNWWTRTACLASDAAFSSMSSACSTDNWGHCAMHNMMQSLHREPATYHARQQCKASKHGC